jgi:hemoglobin
MPRKDISARDDIILLVDLFYVKALKDPLIGPVFTEVAAIDLKEHLPQLYAFWEMLILGTAAYSGQPFPKHLNLGLNKYHFERWLLLFTATVHENFIGLNAELAIQKANNIARLFQHKLGLK